MPKARPAAADSGSPLRSLPSVERLLTSDGLSSLIAVYGRPLVKEAVVAHLATLRTAGAPFDEAEARASVEHFVRAAAQPGLRRVINGSGVIIHTNLGRSPLDAAAWEEAANLVCGYSNLELDLEAGERGSRHDHLSNLCQTVFGCEASVLVNNNAAGTMLLLAALAAGKEVIVSRGELVEIGGGFRVPEVIEQGGARLREVGTTNRTRADDYAAAIGRRTAAILRVHRSNFELVGFTETPSIEDLAEVARKKKVPLLYDEGSGRVADLQKYGLSHEPAIADLLRAGVDALTCSTDKLLGSVQGGLILGRADLIERCRRHPLMRALRAGKEAYALVAFALHAFAVGRHEAEIPIYRMLTVPLDELRIRAERLTEGTPCTFEGSRTALGGGTTPGETVGSIAIIVPGKASAIDAALRHNDPPIVGRIQDDRYSIDLRPVLPEDLPALRQALLRVTSR